MRKLEKRNGSMPPVDMSIRDAAAAYAGFAESRLQEGSLGAVGNGTKAEFRRDAVRERACRPDSTGQGA